jgi:hypothetical protein
MSNPCDNWAVGVNCPCTKRNENHGNCVGQQNYLSEAIISGVTSQRSILAL